MDEVKKDRKILLIILSIAFLIDMVCMILDLKNIEKKCVAFKDDEMIKDTTCYEQDNKYYCKKGDTTFQVEEYNCDI